MCHSCVTHVSPIPRGRRALAGDPLLTAETIEHVTSIVAALGSDAWWKLPVEDLLPQGLRHLAPKLRRGEDTMDVWFDSGSSWAGVVQAGAASGLRFPADLYLEGSDQHRGEAGAPGAAGPGAPGTPARRRAAAGP
jgi:isoleucyl-tRNA synthetase